MVEKEFEYLCKTLHHCISSPTLVSCKFCKFTKDSEKCKKFVEQANKLVKAYRGELK